MKSKRSWTMSVLAYVIPALITAYAAGVGLTKFKHGLSTADALRFPIEIVSLFGEGKPKNVSSMAEYVTEAENHQRKIRELLSADFEDNFEGYSRKGDLESLLGLSRFVTLGSQREADESRGTIDENQVQMRDSKGNRWSGMLLTWDGWFVTAAHCLDPFDEFSDYSETIHFRHVKRKGYGDIREGREYSVSDVLFYDAEHDLAIGRVYVPDMQQPGQKVPILINLYDGDDIHKGREVRVFGFQDYGKLYRQLGKVVRPRIAVRTTDDDGRSIKRSDAFETDAYALPGFSGGTFVDQRTGGLMGIVTSSKSDGESLGLASGVRVNYLLRLINRAVGETLRDDYRADL